MSDDRATRILYGLSTGVDQPSNDVVWRIEALLGHEDEIFVDVRHVRGDDTVGGIGVVITATRVIRAQWSTPRQRVARQSTVTVETWSRRALVMASIDSSEVLGVNTDADWARDWGAEWPADSVLTLRYEGQLEALTLPLLGGTSHRKNFRELVPYLLADLNR
ncbi:hypothetical protein [Lentzea cavernae]|uniref:Polyketide cyclase / dehydrase and lipid transport n=1 Tax=Lentzea cavernae TaxID=2020703 RepID=A0ABQ3MGI2_9PSEU|nr:hypothetical protein [Lentzea cavernae]GHH44047.1 hypothetical protein GCM10017774_42870 [Lentzea cavernae]